MHELKRLHEQQAAKQRSEDQDDYRRKMTQRQVELEEQLEGCLAKCHGLENIKSKMQEELEDMSVEVERVGELNIISNFAKCCCLFYNICKRKSKIEFV